MPLGTAAAVLVAAVVGLAVAYWEVKQARDQAVEALGRETVARQDAERQLAALARSYAARAELEYQRDNWGAALNWMLRAYTEAPLNDPRRASYCQLLAAWAQPPGSPIPFGPQVVDAELPQLLPGDHVHVPLSSQNAKKSRPLIRYAFSTSGCTHGDRYGRRRNLFASSSPTTCCFAESHVSDRPSFIDRFARMHAVVEM